MTQQTHVHMCRKTHRHRHTYTQILHRYTRTHTYMHTQTHTATYIYRHTNTSAYCNTDRYTDTNRQTDRQTHLLVETILNFSFRIKHCNIVWKTRDTLLPLQDINLILVLIASSSYPASWEQVAMTLHSNWASL